MVQSKRSCCCFDWLWDSYKIIFNVCVQDKSRDGRVSPPYSTFSLSLSRSAVEIHCAWLVPGFCGNHAVILFRPPSKIAKQPTHGTHIKYIMDFCAKRCTSKRYRQKGLFFPLRVDGKNIRLRYGKYWEYGFQIYFNILYIFCECCYISHASYNKVINYMTVRRWRWRWRWWWHTSSPYNGLVFGSQSVFISSEGWRVLTTRRASKGQSKVS